MKKPKKQQSNFVLAPTKFYGGGKMEAIAPKPLPPNPTDEQLADYQRKLTHYKALQRALQNCEAVWNPGQPTHTILYRQQDGGLLENFKHNSSPVSSVSITWAVEILLKNFPKAWQLMPLILPKKIRETVYEPAHNDLLRDYLLTKRHKGKYARCWLAFCFCFRTTLMLGSCLKVLAGSKVMDVLVKILPEAVRRWWLH